MLLNKCKAIPDWDGLFYFSDGNFRDICFPDKIFRGDRFPVMAVPVW